MRTKCPTFATICIVVAGLLAACGSSQKLETLELIETEQAPTASPTATPIPTAIPDVLGAIPTEFDASDVSAVFGQTVLQITTADALQSIGETAAADKRQFLVFYGFIYNYGDSEITVHDVDIKLVIEQESGTDFAVPDVKLMNDLSSLNNLNMSFPDRNLPFYPDFKVPPRKAQATLLVYDVPEDSDMLKVQYFSDKPNLTVLVWSESKPITVHKIAHSGDFNIEFAFDEVEDRISEVLDTEIIEVDNCFGTANISREFSFSRESAVTVLAEHRQGVRLGSPLRLPLVGRLLRFEVLDRFQREEMQRLTETRSEVLSASPGTKPRWQLTWYLETISVGAGMNIGDRHYEFTVNVTDRLRSDLKSLPAEQCDN